MRRKPLVLIVDEDPYLAGIYGSRLEAKNCAVKVAETVADARKRVARTMPDAVLVDVSVDAGAGFDLVRELRANPLAVNTPILVVTELGDRESVKKGREAGADTYLIKGHFVPTEAAEKVVRLIEERRK